MKRLEKGLTVSSSGYLQLRIHIEGKFICESFGKDTAFSREVALHRLYEIRQQVLAKRFNFPMQVPQMKFKEAAEIYFDRWSKETNPNGQPAHTPASIYTCRNIIATHIIPFFGDMYFDEIRPKAVQEWRDGVTQKVKGTSANRFQAVLSSIFNHLDRWVKTETISKIKLPDENPVKPIEKARIEKRIRILTQYEAKKLKLACETLKDSDGWEIIKLALKSVLSLKDLRKLEIGQSISIERAKTGVPIDIPLPILINLRWTNWRKRWEAIRREAGLVDFQFRDLRKSGINWLSGAFDVKLISQYAGHADSQTTERFYTVETASKLQPLVNELSKQVDEI